MGGVDGRGLALVNAAVALFGLAGVLADLTGLPAPLAVLGRATFAALALLGLVALRRLSPRVKLADAPLVLGQGALLAAHWTVFFQAIAVSNVAIGVITFATFPLFTAILEPLILGVRPRKVEVAAAFGILGGIAVLVPSDDLAGATAAGIAWGLLGAASFALLTVLNRRLGRAYSSQVVSLYQNAVAAVVLSPLLLVFGAAPLAEPRTVLLLILLGVGCTAVAHTAFIAGLQHMTAQLASLLASLESVWGIAFALLLLGEVPTVRTLVGGAIIVGATVLPVLAARRAPGAG